MTTLDDRITADLVAAAAYDYAVAVQEWQRNGNERRARRMERAEAALVAALDADAARREDAAVMYRILDQMCGSERWTERFPVQPVPTNQRTVVVARDVQRAEDIDRWKAALGRVIERMTERGDDYDKKEPR